MSSHPYGAVATGAGCEACGTGTRRYCPNCDVQPAVPPPTPEQFRDVRKEAEHLEELARVARKYELPGAALVCERVARSIRTLLSYVEHTAVPSQETPRCVVNRLSCIHEPSKML